VKPFRAYVRRNTTFRASLIVFSALVLAVFGWYYQNQRSRFTAEQQRKLSIVSSAKAHAVSAWRNERLADAELLTENRIFSNALVQLLDGSRARRNSGELTEWLASLRKNSGYSCPTLLDTRQHLVAGSGSCEGEAGPETRRLAKKSLETGSGVFVDLHSGPYFRTPHLDLIIPIYGYHDGTKTAAGTLVLRIDPGQQLYPLIASWPSPSDTAELILLRREGNDFVYLNASRHKQRGGIGTRMPIADNRILSALEAGKTAPLVETRDIDGTPVFLEIRKIPGSPWYLAAKIDREEFFRPIRNEAWTLGLMALFVLLATLFGVARIDARQKAKLWEDLYERERQFSTLISNMVGLVYRCDNDRNRTMKSISDGCSTITGYAPDDIIDNRKVEWNGLIVPEDREGVWNAVQAALAGRRPYCLTFRIRHKDGSVRWVWEKGTGVRDENDRLIALEGFIMDITDQKAAEARIKTQAAQLRAIMDNLPFDFWALGGDGRYFFQNNLSREIWGDFRGKAPEEVAPTPEIAGLWRENNRRAFSGEVVRGEIEYQAGNGARSCINILAPMLDESSVLGVIGVNIDITDHKRAVEEMHRSEERYRTLFRELLSGFALHEILCDESGRPVDYRFLEINPAFEKLTGIPGRELVGRTVLEVMPTTEPYWIERYGHVALTGEPDYSVHEASALGKIFESRAFCPEPGRFAVIFNDVTEQARAEEKIRFQASILDQVRNAVIACDLDGRIIYWNAYAETLYQWTEAEAVGQRLHDLLIPEVSRESFRTRAGKLEASGYWEGELVVRRKDGTAFPVFMTDAALTDKHGERTGYVGISVDISERVRLEEQLLHAQKMEAVGRLAGGVAHDFNNILTAIIGYGQILHDGQPPESAQRRHAEHILSAADKAVELTRSLLAFSRKEMMNPKLLDLNTVIKKITHLLARLIGEDIELRTDLLNAPLPAMADCGQIEQVLMNLATNARDAMPQGGKIVIQTDIEYLDRDYVNLYGKGEAGYYVRISFSDTGIGIPEGMREKIYDPFFTTKEMGKGTGLGLSIVHGIVMQHKGFIRLESSPGKGTAFHLYLPSGREEAAGHETASQELPRGGHETILLAEDDKIVRDLNTYILESYGYRVIAAGDGQEAVDRFVENSHDIKLLVLDVVMPRKNGAVVYSEIEKLSPGVQVLFVSGYTADILGSKGLIEDRLNFIAKPLSPTDLLGKVREVLDSADRQTPGLTHPG